MASDDRFRQYSEAGEEFLEGARTRAVDFLRELARVGQGSGKQAQGSVDDIVDAGRRSTEAILEVVRREIATQLGQLGLATRADLDALERRVTGTRGRSTGSPATGSPATKAPVTRAPSSKAAATKAAKGAAPAKAAAPAAKAARKAPARAAGPAKQAARKAPAKKAGGTTSS